MPPLGCNGHGRRWIAHTTGPTGPSALCCIIRRPGDQREQQQTSDRPDQPYYEEISSQVQPYLFDALLFRSLDARSYTDPEGLRLLQTDVRHKPRAELGESYTCLAKSLLYSRERIDGHLWHSLRDRLCSTPYPFRPSGSHRRGSDIRRREMKTGPVVLAAMGGASLVWADLVDDVMRVPTCTKYCYAVTASFLGCDSRDVGCVCKQSRNLMYYAEPCVTGVCVEDGAARKTTLILLLRRGQRYTDLPRARGPVTNLPVCQCHLTPYSLSAPTPRPRRHRLMRSSLRLLLSSRWRWKTRPWRTTRTRSTPASAPPSQAPPSRAGPSCILW